MARIQKLESDSSFNLSNVLEGKILTYKTLENGRVVHKAKLHDGSVVEITPKSKGVSAQVPLEINSNSQGIYISLNIDSNALTLDQGSLTTTLTLYKLLTVSDSGTITLDHSLYNRWEFTGTGDVSLQLSNWEDGDRGQVVINTAVQAFSIPADWIMPDKVWDAWIEAPGTYCMQIRKQGGVVYAHAAVPFSTGQDSDAQEIPVNLSARLQAVQAAVVELSDSLSSAVTRISTLQSAVDALSQAAWSTLQWASTLALSGANGARQKVVVSGNTTITPPTLSQIYTELTLQVSKNSSYSITVNSVTYPLNESVLLSWYWDGAVTRKLPILFLGD